MKRIFVSLTVALVFFWAAASLSAESGGGAPNGTVMIHLTRVALGVGLTKGEGYLRYKGDSYSSR